MQTNTQFVFRQFLEDRHFISLSVNTFLQKICFACQQTNNKIMCHICKMRERNNQELALKCCKKNNNNQTPEITQERRANVHALCLQPHACCPYSVVPLLTVTLLVDFPQFCCCTAQKGRDGHSSRWQWDSWWRVRSTEAPCWVCAPCRSTHDPKRQARHEWGRGQMDSSLSTSSETHRHHRGRLSLWVRWQEGDKLGWSSVTFLFTSPTKRSIGFQFQIREHGQKLQLANEHFWVRLPRSWKHF